MLYLNISESIFIAAVCMYTSLDWMQAENALTQGYLMFGLDTQLLVLDTRYTDTNIDCQILKCNVFLESPLMARRREISSSFDSAGAVFARSKILRRPL